MSDDPGLIPSIWHPSTAFAGLAGGVVGAWADGKASLKMWLIYAACGFLTGNFLGKDATHFIPYVSEGGAGFLVGGCALSIMWLFKNLVQKWQQPPAQTGEGKP